MSRRELTKAELKTAANLKAIIKDKGYTQKQIATVMGFTSQGIVSQYCNGTIPLSDAVAIKFAKALNVPLDAIKADLSKKLEKIDIKTVSHLKAATDNHEVGVLKGDYLYIEPDLHKAIQTGFYALDMGQGISAYQVIVEKGLVKIMDVQMPVERANILNIKGRIVKVVREW